MGIGNQQRLCTPIETNVEIWGGRYGEKNGKQKTRCGATLVDYEFDILCKTATNFGNQYWGLHWDLDTETGMLKFHKSFVRDNWNNDESRPVFYTDKMEVVGPEEHHQLQIANEAIVNLTVTLSRIMTEFTREDAINSKGRDHAYTNLGTH